MTILIIDGQGGGLGRQLVSAVKEAYPGHTVLAIGTNSLATSAMLKAGADQAATGENAVVVSCRRADVIIGPVGHRDRRRDAGRNHASDGHSDRAEQRTAHFDSDEPVR